MIWFSASSLFPPKQNFYHWMPFCLGSGVSWGTWCLRLGLLLYSLIGIKASLIPGRWQVSKNEFEIYFQLWSGFFWFFFWFGWGVREREGLEEEHCLFQCSSLKVTFKKQLYCSFSALKRSTKNYKTILEVLCWKMRANKGKIPAFESAFVGSPYPCT